MMVGLKVFFFTSLFWIFVVVGGWSYMRFIDMGSLVSTIFPNAVNGSAVDATAIQTEIATLSGNIISIQSGVQAIQELITTKMEEIHTELKKTTDTDAAVVPETPSPIVAPTTPIATVTTATGSTQTGN